MRNILIIDGNYLMHRYSRIPEYNLTNSQGTPTGTVFGVLRSIYFYLKEYPTDCVYFVVDGHRSNRRKEIYPEYKRKATKELTEEQKATDETFWNLFNDQQNRLMKLLPNMNVHVVHIDSKEGDDVCYKLGKDLESDDISICYLTEDSDYVSFIGMLKNTKVYRPMKQLEVSRESADEDVDWFLIKKILVGDKSDNIPPVMENFGPKSVNKLLEAVKLEGHTPTTPNLIDHIIEVSALLGGSRYDKFYDNREEVKKNYLRNEALIDVSKEEWSEEELNAYKEAVNSEVSFNVGTLTEVFRLLEFKSLASILVEPHFKLLR